MSSGSESDDEYVPGEPEQVSEEDSADEETDLQFEKELEHKTKKRKAAPPAAKGKKKKVTRNSAKKPDSESENETEKQPEEQLDPEEEKKRADDLWAMFLEGTDTKPKPTPKVDSKTNDPIKTTTDQNKEKALVNNDKKPADDNKERERRIFEFAGETIVVENDVIKEKIKTAEAPAIVGKQEGPSRPRVSGGVAGILGQLNKKNTLSTLEKSKLDWLTYKKEEGIEEEIQSHNKGKAGYLDRKDFLERADLRQYEIERDLRLSKRSNR